VGATCCLRVEVAPLGVTASLVGIHTHVPPNGLSISLLGQLPAYVVNSILQDNAESAVEEYCDILLERDVRNTLFKSSVNSE